MRYAEGEFGRGEQEEKVPIDGTNAHTIRACKSE